MKRFKDWWKKSSQNEKIMYALIFMLVIGIGTRWAYVKTELSDSVAEMFSSDSVELEQGSEKSGGVPVFEMPKPPSMLSDLAAQQWMAKNYWGDTNPSDYIEHQEVFMPLMAQWAPLLQALPVADTHELIKSFMERVKDNPEAISMLLLALEDVFYSPNVQVRNFEAYIPALEWVISNPLMTEEDKERPKSQLEMAVKNRVNTRANNFSFITIDGENSSLYKVKAEYTMVFINNPGCAACRDYKEMLMSDKRFADMVDNGTIVVVAIFPDAGEDEWRKYSVDMPKSWINGFDSRGDIKQEELYDCSAVPSMYLLDRDKIVLLKDASPMMLLYYMQNI